MTIAGRLRRSGSTSTIDDERQGSTVAAAGLGWAIVARETVDEAAGWMAAVTLEGLEPGRNRVAPLAGPAEVRRHREGVDLARLHDRALG